MLTDLTQRRKESKERKVNLCVFCGAFVPSVVFNLRFSFANAEQLRFFLVEAE